MKPILAELVLLSFVAAMVPAAAYAVEIHAPKVALPPINAPHISTPQAKTPASTPQVKLQNRSTSVGDGGQGGVGGQGGATLGGGIEKNENAAGSVSLMGSGSLTTPPVAVNTSAGSVSALPSMSGNIGVGGITVTEPNPPSTGQNGSIERKSTTSLPAQGIGSGGNGGSVSEASRSPVCTNCNDVNLPGPNNP